MDPSINTNKLLTAFNVFVFWRGCLREVSEFASDVVFLEEVAFLYDRVVDDVVNFVSNEP